jgi:hypothetical protein
MSLSAAYSMRATCTNRVHDTRCIPATDNAARASMDAVTRAPPWVRCVDLWIRLSAPLCVHSTWSAAAARRPADKLSTADAHAPAPILLVRIAQAITHHRRNCSVQTHVHIALRSNGAKVCARECRTARGSACCIVWFDSMLHCMA